MLRLAVVGQDAAASAAHHLVVAERRQRREDLVQHVVLDEVEQRDRPRHVTAQQLEVLDPCATERQSIARAASCLR